jgi:hypothetical protein|tara:strand:+ start:1693 stop:2175 length:483 start_codon:yes stop_codon:yes gene_type:complete
MMIMMPRSAAIHWGHKWPSDVAVKVNGKFVTWQEVHDKRRQRQAETIRRIRQPEPPKVIPCYIWTFYNDTVIYGGWYCYLCTLRDGSDFSGKFGVEWSDQAAQLMQAVNVGLFPIEANWEAWMTEIANFYPRNHPTDRRRAGSVVGWFDTDAQKFEARSA